MNRATPAVGQELQAFAYYFEFAAFFASFLVVPSVHLQAAFNIGTTAFGEVLLGEFRLTPPERDIDKDCFFLLLILLVVPNPVNGKRNVRNRSALGRVTQFRVTGQIPDEHNFVKIGHSGSGVANSDVNWQAKTVLPNNFRTSGDAQEMLEVDVSVETQALVDSGDNVRGSLEGEVHVVTRFKVAAIVGELTAAELGDFLQLGTFGFEFFGDSGDEIVHGAIEGFGVKDNQSLVFAAHRCAV